MLAQPSPFCAPAQPMCRKRKAESQDNERLSKRMSLLNIERSGARLHVPVEDPNFAQPLASSSNFQNRPTSPGLGQTHAPRGGAPAQADGMMMLDDTKHKVYIYNLEDELSSSESEDDASSKLVFLSNIDKHLLANRIPPRVLPQTSDNLAGMQLVLYREPTALTVSEEQDGVRRAVVEARERLRERQRTTAAAAAAATREDDRSGVRTGVNVPSELAGGGQDAAMEMDYDPDAMDLG